MLAGLIDGWKNRGLMPSQVPSGEAAVFGNGRGGKLYGSYQERLKILNAADFGDLLLENIRLFREHPDVLRHYQNRFKFILVDEYQDTNVAQYLWLRLFAQAPASLTSPRLRGEVGLPGSALARLSNPGEGEPTSPPVSAVSAPHPDPLPVKDGEREKTAAPAPSPKNICCVGDDDQSIYGWRGAEVDNILRFEHDFPGAKVIRLESNYRSTGHILDAASHLIEPYESRLRHTH